MAGTIRVNIFAGVIAFIVIFLTALSENVWLVSLERGLVAFLLFFLIAYIFRWLVRMLFPPTEENAVGNHIDLVTPSESAIDLPKASENEPPDTFTPLVTDKIQRNADVHTPDNIANVIRRLTDE